MTIDEGVRDRPGKLEPLKRFVPETKHIGLVPGSPVFRVGILQRESVRLILIFKCRQQVGATDEASSAPTSACSSGGSAASPLRKGEGTGPTH